MLANVGCSLPAMGGELGGGVLGDGLNGHGGCLGGTGVQVDDTTVVDTTAREEAAAEQMCHIAVRPTGSICGLFRGGGAAITPFALQVTLPLPQQQQLPTLDV